MPRTDLSTVTEAQVRAATRATFATFAGCGIAFSSWASRIPAVRNHLHLTPGALGTVLLAIAAGSLIALPSAGPIVARVGSRRTVVVMALLLALGLAVIAVGDIAGIPVLVVGLFLLGFALGALEVGMNVQGATVERHLGRTIMPRFHAGFSIATVVGALLGAVMVLAHLTVTVHLLAIAAVVGIVVPAQARNFLADSEGNPALPSAPADPEQPTSIWARWREPRTLVVGLIVLAFAFAEGAGSDWISVALIDDYHAPIVVGTFGFAVFLAAMTAGRWFGPTLLDRYGRVAVMRALSVLAIAGLGLFALSPNTPLAFLATLLWGAGASLGFPVGMSAAADDPAAAAGRVSVVASIGYCAFLAGPPVVGLVGDVVTVRTALLVVTVLLVVAVFLTPALRSDRTAASPPPPYLGVPRD